MRRIRAIAAVLLPVAAVALAACSDAGTSPLAPEVLLDEECDTTAVESSCAVPTAGSNN